MSSLSKTTNQSLVEYNSNSTTQNSNHTAENIVSTTKISNLKNTLVFIDHQVADYQILINDLAKESKWYLLDENSDGISQIAAILAEQNNRLVHLKN